MYNDPKAAREAAYSRQLMTLFQFPTLEDLSVFDFSPTKDFLRRSAEFTSEGLRPNDLRIDRFQFLLGKRNKTAEETIEFANYLSEEMCLVPLDSKGNIRRFEGVPLLHLDEKFITQYKREKDALSYEWMSCIEAFEYVEEARCGVYLFQDNDPKKAVYMGVEEIESAMESPLLGRTNLPMYALSCRPRSHLNYLSDETLAKYRHLFLPLPEVKKVIEFAMQDGSGQGYPTLGIQIDPAIDNTQKYLRVASVLAVDYERRNKPSINYFLETRLSSLMWRRIEEHGRLIYDRTSYS